MRFSVSTPQEFLSTPSARRATPHLRPKILPFRISIHALREEGDAVGYLLRACGVISIHTLREEGDVMDNAYQTLLGQFLSTPSARRATSW